jgi:DNA-binding CsgD family transcriptional regulator
MDGETTKSAAVRLRCSDWTVKFHCRNVRRKMRVQSILKAVCILLEGPASMRS